MAVPPLRWTCGGSKWRQGFPPPLHLEVGEVRTGLARGPPMTGVRQADRGGSIIRETLCNLVFAHPLTNCCVFRIQVGSWPDTTPDRRKCLMKRTGAQVRGSWCGVDSKHRESLSCPTRGRRPAWKLAGGYTEQRVPTTCRMAACDRSHGSWAHGFRAQAPK